MQTRLNIPDDVWNGLDQYSALSKNTIVTMALQAIAPLSLPKPERDMRFLAALQGRLDVVILTDEEATARKLAAQEAITKAQAEAKAKAAAAMEVWRQRQAQKALAEPAPDPKPEEPRKVISDPTGLETLPPMKNPTGGDDPLGMSSPQIAPGEGRRDHA